MSARKVDLVDSWISEEEEEEDDQDQSQQNSKRRSYGTHLTSPINIESKEAVFSSVLYGRPLDFYYVETRESVLQNTGTTIKLDLAGSPSDLTGGPLDVESSYRLAEIRFHWGRNNERGSEHTVNGHPFPMEVQLVHYNTKLYECLDEALGRPNGVAVVSLFVQIGKQNNGLQPIIQNLWNVQYKDESKAIPVMFNPESFLPHATLRDFWSYKGSITWTPYVNNVDWILMRYPMTASPLQVEQFRHMNMYKKGVDKTARLGDGSMLDNFMPVKPLNGRTILASFE